MTDTRTIYNFTVLRQNQDLLSLDHFKGQVLLIVNTATGCGLASQYRELQALYDRLLY